MVWVLMWSWDLLHVSSAPDPSSRFNKSMSARSWVSKIKGVIAVLSSLARPTGIWYESLPFLTSEDATCKDSPHFLAVEEDRCPGVAAFMYDPPAGVQLADANALTTASNSGIFVLNSLSDKSVGWRVAGANAPIMASARSHER